MPIGELCGIESGGRYIVTKHISLEEWLETARNSSIQQACFHRVYVLISSG